MHNTGKNTEKLNIIFIIRDYFYYFNILSFKIIIIIIRKNWKLFF